MEKDENKQEVKGGHRSRINPDKLDCGAKTIIRDLERYPIMGRGRFSENMQQSSTVIVRAERIVTSRL